MSTITALFGPPIRPRLTVLEQRLDALDRARRALAALRTTQATPPAPTYQENTSCA